MSLCTLPPNNHGHRQDGRGLIALRVSNTERHFFTADEEASLQDFDDGSHRWYTCGIDEVEVVMAWRAYIPIGRRGDLISARHGHRQREFIEALVKVERVSRRGQSHQRGPGDVGVRRQHREGFVILDLIVS